VAKPVDEDDLEDPPLPGYRNYLIYCDESGIDGQVFYGFGSLWLPWERRGDLTGLVQRVRDAHRYYDEIKWSKINRRSVAFYKDMVGEFFARNWLMFHCVVVRKGYVDRSRHKDFDEARRKHFAMLIKAKVKFFSSGAANKAYHARVDPLPSRYDKADEAALKIVAATLKKELGLAPLRTLRTVDSKTSPGVQVADLLLGAAMADWQEKDSSEFKRAVRVHVAEHLGWKDLRADTKLTEWKFNIWYFHDPRSGGSREATTRPVKLLVPMPPWRSRR
jgi:hypothetical protein